MVQDLSYSATESCRIRFSPNPPYTVLACDRLNGLSGSDGKAVATQYPISVQNYFVPNETLDGVSGMDGEVAVTQYPLSVTRCPTPIDTINGLSGSDGKFVATVYSLTGGIVG